MGYFFRTDPKKSKRTATAFKLCENSGIDGEWGHYNHDMAACAAPIYRQSSKEMVAVLSVSCPISTYDETTFKQDISKQVIETAEKISKFIY